MASFKQYTAGGGASEAFSIETFSSDEIKVYVDNVLKTATTHYNITSYTANGGTVTWTSGNVPASPAVVRIVRDTGVTTARATYSAGSSIKAGDLNDNQTQALRSLEEQDDQLIQTYDVQDSAITTAKIKADNITGALIADDQINSEHYVAGSIDLEHMSANSVDSDQYVDGSIDLVHMSANSVDSDQYVDGSIDLVHMSANSVDSDQYVDGSVDHVHLANDVIDGDNIQDDVINSEHIAAGAVDLEHMSANSVDSAQYVDGSIDTVHLADNSVTGAKLAAGTIVTSDLADGAVTLAKVGPNAIGTSQLLDSCIQSSKLQGGSVTTAKILDSNVTTAKIAADAVTAAKIGDDVINSEHIAAGAVDLEHMSANSVDSDQYVDGSIEEVHLNNNIIGHGKIINGAVITTKIGDDAVTTAKIAADAITGAKIADNAIGAEHIAANAVTTSEIADAELTTLAGMQTGTASILAAGTTLTATLAEINTVVDGKSVETTISDTDAAYPTSGAVVDYVAAQLAPVGGLEVVATDAAFPNTQPSAGVVISIADAGGLVVNGSGTSTTGRTVGGSTVTINNIASNFNSTTVDNGVAMMVSSTGSGQIYNYHKATLKEADLLSLSGDINDFAERYKVAGSAPSSSLDEGDLWWDTATDKLKVYSGASSSWEEVASAGDFYINTIASYSGTGGNSASFNGSAYRFVLSNPGTTAQQHVVSINGVIQKPNSGTSQPSEGFAIDGSSIIFSNAPATGSDYFILTLGTTVSIGTPSDNTVATAKIQNLAVTTDKIAADAITAAKIASGAVTTAKIADSAITTAKLAGSAVSTGAIAGSAVTTAKIAADAITGATIADDAVGAEHIEVLDAALQFGDNVKAQFGASNDLAVYHNNGTSYIDATAAGNTNAFAFNTAANLDIRVNSNEQSIYATANGGVELFYNSVKKLETESWGVGISGSLHLDDGAPSTSGITIGNGNDLQIFHDASHSYLHQSGTGELKNRAAIWKVVNEANSEIQIKATENAAVELYYNGVKKCETHADGLHIGDGGNLDMPHDSAKIVMGAGDDLQIYHDGSNSYLQNGTGTLFVRAKTTETGIAVVPDGAVELYHNNTKQLYTHSGGVYVVGFMSADSFYLNDNEKSYWGTGDDLQIYHNGSNNHIDTTLAGAGLKIRHNYSSGNMIDSLDINDQGRMYNNCNDGSHCNLTLRKTNNADSIDYFQCRSGAGNLKFVIQGDGDAYNANNEWGSSSDVKLKENIVDANSQWNDIKAVKVRNFNFKASTGLSTDKHIGVVAQEIETVSTGLVSEAIDRDPDTGEDLGTKTKQVKYSILYMKAIKALQEAMAKIETLETKVAALEAK